MLKSPHTKERFVVLTEGRSGSTLLIMSLAQHPDITMYGEIFDPKRPDDLHGIAVTTPYHPGLDSAHFAQQTFASATGKAAGFKLLYHQVPGESVWDYLANTKVKIVRLSRSNLLHVMISWTVGHTTKQWHARRGETILAALPFRLEPENAERFFKHCKEYRESKAELFSQNEVLDITYEDLTGDFLNTVHRVFDFLGLEKHDPEPLLIKTGRPPLAVLENYEELKQHFQGTEYESFFDE